MATLKEPFALDRSLNTTELTPRNIADVLAEELSRITGRNASQVEYDNTESGLTADNVQDALDEIVEDIPTVPSVDIQTAVDEFSTYNGGLLSSLKVSLTPNQDLHGYDSPWVGGSRKNKFDDNAKTSGVYLTTDGTTTGSGASDATDYIPIDGSVTLSYKYDNLNSSNTRIICFYDENKQFTEYSQYTPTDADKYKKVTFTPTDPNSVYVRFTLDKGAYDVQVELGSTATAYEPYENICPISGHTQVDVGDDGKNKFDGTFTDYTIIWSDGSVISNQNHKTSPFISVDPNTDYVLSGTDLYTRYSGETTGAVIYAFYDKDQNFLYWSDVIYSGDVVMHTTADTRYIRFDCGGKATDVQLELGSTATDYVPYNGYQITVNLGGTYYWLRGDVVSGKWYVVGKSVDMGTLTWTKYDVSQGTLFRASISDIKMIANQYVVPNIVCSQYFVIAQINRVNGSITQVANSASVDVIDNRYSDATSFKSAMSGVQLVYELANPTPIQLSPTMVKALVGENHLSAPLDGQEITESKYRQLFTWDEVEAYVNAHSGGGSGMNYSTEEQVVGTWIDGKPIYKRTWDFSSSPIMLSYADWVDSGISASENIKAIMSAELKYGSVILANVEVGINVDGYAVGFQKLDNINTRGVSYCTLIYTKTTD